MSLIAKPVINKQYWILQENDRKVGNVEACAGGYQIKINNQVIAQFKTIKMVEQRANIRFEPPMIVTAPRKKSCLLYTSPSPRDRTRSRMPSSA